MITTTLPRIKKAPQSKSTWQHLSSWLVYCRNLLRTWQHRHQMRHDLQGLSGWLLEDIGLRRVEGGWEMNTATFWQP
jgi:uncharacterized protein YjiS (DUF1127 family)